MLSVCISLYRSLSLSLSDLSIDINECLAAALESANLCESNQNTQCVNNDGSYDCVCVPGYNRVNGSCHRKLHFWDDILIPVISQFANNRHS